MKSRIARSLAALAVLGATLASVGATKHSPLPASSQRSLPLGAHVVLSWNDLGMHCMNQYHADFSVLPPYNTLVAQVIRRGDATTRPQLVAGGIRLEYSVPGNTTSAGKTDFWTYAPALFGVALPPDIGLAGKGLTGTMDPAGTRFEAVGIPVTPFTDATPTVESPYQQALVIATDLAGAELARSTPVIPVSTEINCVSSGCHSSVNSILNGHEREGGFDPNARPILCARCHASPALGTAGDPEAGYFSFRIHDKHQFMDATIGGIAACYKCHPGPNTQCLRGAMKERHGLTCQNCHGNMANVARTIENGRVPWVNEPACGTCHLPQFAEPAGQLYRNSTGHGGVACAACHGSPHADFPSREPADNANNVSLQGHAGTLNDCRVCHGVVPSGPGPHGVTATAVESSVMQGSERLHAYPNPARSVCTFAIEGRPGEAGRLTLFDSQGRIVRMLSAAPSAAASTLRWDLRDAGGLRVPAGTYFARWQQGQGAASARVTVVR